MRSYSRLIGGDADVAVTVRIGAACVIDVVDAALVVCISRHLGLVSLLACASSLSSAHKPPARVIDALDVAAFGFSCNYVAAR